MYRIILLQVLISVLDLVETRSSLLAAAVGKMINCSKLKKANELNKICVPEILA